MRDLLSTVRQKPVKTSKGVTGLPILYRDASQVGVFFSADLERARGFLDGTDLEPWPVLGRAMVAIYAWEYRDSTVGTYNEVGLGIQVRRRGTKPSLIGLARDMKQQPEQGIWVVNLPVTTEEAFAAGVELWGYPKYVTPIETRFGESETFVRLGDELELRLPRPRGPKTRGFPVVTFTSRGGSLLRTVIETDCDARWGTGFGAEVNLLGDGPTARSLKKLGLEEPRALMGFRTDLFRAVLPLGEEVSAL